MLDESAIPPPAPLSAGTSSTVPRGIFGPAEAPERQFKLLVDNISDLVFVSDNEGVLTWVSPSITRVFGWSPEELVGTTLEFIAHPDDLGPALERRRAYTSGETDRFSMVLRIREHSGEYSWVSAEVHRAQDEQGNDIGRITCAHVVDDLMAARAELSDQRDLLRALLDSIVDPLVLLRPVLDTAGRIVDFVYVEANHAARIEDRLEPRQLEGDSLLRAVPTELESGLFRRYCEVMATGEPLLLEDFSYPPHAGHAEGVRIDLRASKVGDELAVMWRDVTLRGARTRAIIESEERLRLLSEQAAEITVWHVSGVVRWVSASLRQLLGWDPEDWIGHDLIEFIHPDDQAEAAEQNKRTELGEKVQARRRYRAKDGSYHWVNIHMGMFRDAAGEPAGVVATFTSVDSQVAAEQALRESEHRFRMLAENSSDVVYEVDGEGVITWISPSVTPTLGWTVEELVGTRSADLVHPDDREGLRLRREAALASGLREPPSNQDVRYLTRSGDHVWMSLRVTALRDDEGWRGAVVSMRDVTIEHNAHERLAYQAFHDPLTGLRNRAWVLDMLDADIRAAKRNRKSLAVLFLDLDNFKIVNDSLGHQAGDTVLREIANRIASTVRPGDRVGRFGGDEFIVVLRGAGDTDEIEQVTRRINDTLRPEISVSDHVINPTTSIGIALMDDTSTPGSLLRDADAALFRAKSAGRNQWQFFDAGMYDRALARLTREEELRRAIDEREFVMHYQPILRLHDRRIVRYEALLRWQHPQLGMLPPSEFLEVAEDTGLIVPLGAAVLDQVCETIAAHPEFIGRIAVNVSTVQLNRADWYQQFVDACERNGVPPARLAIEVTESAVLNLPSRRYEELAHLHSLGVELHVDDFGTGFSSISLLRDLPLTGIKLDTSFVSELTDHHTAATSLAAGLAGLAAGLDLECTAEGVELQRQEDVLAAQGWTHCQGYLYGHPSANL